MRLKNVIGSKRIAKFLQSNYWIAKFYDTNVLATKVAIPGKLVKRKLG